MKLFKTQKAASTTEYGLMLGLIAVGILVSVQSTGTEVNSIFGKVTGELNEQVGSNNGSSGGSGAAPPASTPTSCRDILNANPSASSGSYEIDLDGDAGANPAFTVECDMTTNGGGWTKLIADGSNSFAHLQQFNPVNNAITGYTVSGSLGASWGTTTTVANWSNPTYNSMLFPISYTELRITASGTYNSPSGGLGRLIISDQAGTSIYELYDHHTDASEGQTLRINGSSVLYRQLIDISNRTDTVSHTGTALRIKMSAPTSPYPYTRRYVRNIWYR